VASIVEFLEARIAEDEAIATVASPGPWIWKGDASEDEASLYDSNDALVLSAYGMHTQGFLECSGENAAHIARHDPARALADCEAKWQILKLHVVFGEHNNPRARAMWQATGGVLKILAGAYKDHPDYQQEWARG
jgi:hypothetical protein